jgi:hypothetical protein
MAYQVPDCYDRALAMGNVFEQPFEKILQSAAYADSLTRAHVERQQVCSSCEYRGPCSTLPLFDSRRADWRGERCAIAYEMYRAVEKELQARRMGACRIRAFVRLRPETVDRAADTYPPTVLRATRLRATCFTLHLRQFRTCGNFSLEASQTVTT